MNGTIRPPFDRAGPVRPCPLDDAALQNRQARRNFFSVLCRRTFDHERLAGFTHIKIVQGRDGFGEACGIGGGEAARDSQPGHAGPDREPFPAISGYPQLETAGTKMKSIR